MLHCFVSLYSLISYKKILQEENVIVLIHSFPCSLATAAAIIFHVRVCEVKISICNRWELEEFKTTCKLLLKSFLEAFSLFLVFSVQTKQNVMFDTLSKVDSKCKS